MRVISAIALIGATSAKPAKKATDIEVLDLSMFESDTTTTEVITSTTAAPTTKKAMPTLPPNYRPMFSEDPDFQEFATKHHFPPIVQEREMMAKMGYDARFKHPQQNPFFNSFNNQQPKNLQCMECSGQNYEHCYANARLRECPQQEKACFLEVRYRGSQVVSVQSGCSQEVACINNMKQNFYDFNEFGLSKVDRLNSGAHDCKIYSANSRANSVCRNCCFSDNCTDGWQPNSFEDWNIADRKEVKKQMKLFDQFVYSPQPQSHVQRQVTQYANSLEDLNRAPTFADLDSNKNINRQPVAKKQPRDHVANYRARQLAEQQQRLKQQQAQQQARQQQLQRQQQIAKHQEMQKQQQLQRERAQGGPSSRFAQPKVINVRTTKVTTTRKPITRKTTTRRVMTTRKPTTTKKSVSDDDFMALIAKLESDKVKDQDKKSTSKSSLAKKKAAAKKSKPSIQLKSASKTTVAPKTTEAPKTKATTKAKVEAKKPTGKGPWSHLPPWKQRQLQAARAKAIAAAKAKKQAMMTKKTKAAQPQMMKFSSQVEAPGKAVLEEGEIIEVNTSLSDEDFGKLIASIDTKDKNADFDAIISAIEAEKN